MEKTQTPSDKEINKAIHRLFWRSMLKFRRDFWLIQLHIVYFIIFTAVFFVEIAYGLEAIVDNRYDDLWTHITRMLLGLAASFVVFIIGGRAFNRHQVNNAKNVVQILFNNYMAKDYQFFEDQHVGALSAYAARMRQATNDYTRVFMFDIVRIVSIVGTGIVVLLVYSPVLALVTLFCMSFVLLSVFGAQKYRTKYRKHTSETESQLAGVLGDSLSHATVVKSFGAQDYESKRLDSSLDAWRLSQRKVWDLGVTIANLRNILLITTMIILLLVSARMYKNGEIGIAVITLVQLYVVRLVAVTVEITDIVKLYEPESRIKTSVPLRLKVGSILA